MRVTPAVDVFYYDPVVPEPYLAVWEGHVDTSWHGEYRFRTNGAGVMKLFIDDEILAHSPESETVRAEAAVILTQGRHRIRVEYLSESPPSELEVLWAPPDQGRGPIPIERLSPAAEHMFRIVSSGE